MDREWTYHDDDHYEPRPLHAFWAMPGAVLAIVMMVVTFAGQFPG